jgi:branched-chain amino acid transport system ATP-binding protein
MPIIDRGYVVENGSLVLSGTGGELLLNPEVRAAYFGA